MAILFFEGLPRSGKSYESMVTQIIPWLQRGKEVVAYIEGLDTVECQQRIAEAADLPLERVQELLFPLTREDMRPRTVKRNGKDVAIDGVWIEKTRDNALHVYDEAQNWWPNRLRATEELTQFVTEHGHRGATILLMGQSLKDVLALWRRRVDQKFTFLKLTALGQDGRYRVTVYKGQGDDQFVKVSDKLGKYDPKYFGTYKSHVSDETDTETYTDNRVNVLKSAAFKYGAFVAVGLVIWGAPTAWKFFHPAPPASPSVTTGPASPLAGAVGVQTVAIRGTPPEVKKSAQEAYFSGLSEKGRVRLAGLMDFKGVTGGVVEWVAGDARVIERISFETLRGVGVNIIVTRDAAWLSLGAWREFVTMWPVESNGRVSETRQEGLRPYAPAGGPGDGTVRASGGPVVIDSVRGIPTPQAPPGGPAGSSQPRVPKTSPWSFQTAG